MVGDRVDFSMQRESLRWNRAFEMQGNVFEAEETITLNSKSKPR